MLADQFGGLGWNKNVAQGRHTARACTCMHVYMPGNGQDREEFQGWNLERKFLKIRIKMHCQGYEGNLVHRLPTECELELLVTFPWMTSNGTYMEHYLCRWDYSNSVSNLLSKSLTMTVASAKPAVSDAAGGIIKVLWYPLLSSFNSCT